MVLEDISFGLGTGVEGGGLTLVSCQVSLKGIQRLCCVDLLGVE
jgi:hypothetical protein